jgi:hypothetical protein
MSVGCFGQNLAGFNDNSNSEMAEMKKFIAFGSSLTFLCI